MSTDDYTPTTEQVRNSYGANAWDYSHPEDELEIEDGETYNHGRPGYERFDRWLAAHDAALLAAHPAPAFKTGWVNGENYIASNAAHPATAIDREAIAEAIWRSDLDYTPKPDHWSTLTDGHRDEYRANADAVLALLASGVLNGQSS